MARSRSTSARPRSHPETDPLLAREKTPPNPLPRAQLAVIYAIKLTLPIAHTQAMPYFNVLIGKLAASEGADTGYYSGVTHSVTSVAQFTSMFFWGRLGSYTGHRTAMSAFFTLGFGLSGSLVGLILNRALAGFFHGITGAIHSVVGELCDETNETIAFPLYDIVSAVGFAIGGHVEERVLGPRPVAGFLTRLTAAQRDIMHCLPIAFIVSGRWSIHSYVSAPLIGGTFENPADKWPDVFSNPLWQRYPYLLPCLLSPALSLSAALLSIFMLQETLPRKRKQLIVGEEPVVAASSTDAIIDMPEDDFKPHSVKDLLSIEPVLCAVFASSSALGFAGSAFNSGFVLMAYTPLEQGGLALSPSQIGRALSGMGTVSIPLKLCMPTLLHKFGTLNVFDFSMLAWSACFLSMPLASWIAQASTGITPIDGRAEKYREGSAMEWASVSLTLFLSRLGCLAFSIIMILTRDHTPGHASLGTANGLAELAQSLAAAIGPTVISSLFAVSAKRHLLGGYIWVVFMLVLSAFGSWMVK